MLQYDFQCIIMQSDLIWSSRTIKFTVKPQHEETSLLISRTQAPSL